MNISSFITQTDYLSIKEKVSGGEVFSVKRKIKVPRGEVGVCVDGRIVDDWLAKNVWHGKNYLVGFACDYAGKMGYGGSGGCTEKTDVFMSWETFKEWFDKKMRGIEGYEVEEYGQMRLF